MKNSIKDFMPKKPAKPEMKICQARVKVQVYKAFHRASRAKKMTVQEAMETALNWFIDSAKGA